MRSGNDLRLSDVCEEPNSKGFLGKPDFSDELVANRGQLLVLLDLLIDVAFEAGGLRFRLLNDGSQTCYLGILQKNYYWLNHFKNIGTFVISFSSRQKITIIVIIYSELEVLNYNMSCFKNEAKLFITINLITTNLEQDLLVESY